VFLLEDDRSEAIDTDYFSCLSALHVEESGGEKVKGIGTFDMVGSYSASVFDA